jgi:hypothetical protein
MKATVLRPPETLRISWGTTAVYPTASRGISSGATRFSGAGHTDIELERGARGVRLFSPGSLAVSAISQGQQSTGDLQPFPTDISDLFGRIFVPIGFPLDLYNDRLLRYKSKPTGATSVSYEDRAPGLLVLLSPTTYVKAEPNDAVATAVAQFVTDGRRAPNEDSGNSAQHFMRRFIVMGLTDATYSKAAVQQELARLIDSAKLHSASPADGHVMAVFANQSSLDVRCRVSVNGRSLEMPQPRRRTWAHVIDTAMPLLYLAPAPSSGPALVVQRVRRAPDGTPLEHMTVRVHRIDHAVLYAAQIAEGDDFASPAAVPANLR